MTLVELIALFLVIFSGLNILKILRDWSDDDDL